MTKLLILASNPRRDLNLDREVSDLNNAVRRFGDFEVELGLGVRSQELQELLAEHSPQFVHFCGHGAGEKGLVFQDEDGREQSVSTEILARIFKTFAEEIHCTVLNACDSDRQAEAIVEHIDYVVGMSQPILDKAAHLFAVGFYKGLGAGKSIEQAYEMGCIAIQIWWSEAHSQPNQSRQYRKLTYAGELVQPAQPEMAEYLKPVLLKKSDRFPASVTRLGSVPGVPLASVQADPPQEFVEFVHQAIDRKDYKDQARAAYDNFGQFSSQNAVSISKSEYKQRQILLSKVKQFWIEGFLRPSLQGVDSLSLELKARPDAIADLSQGIEALSVELDASYERLQETRIYQEMGQGRTLLILGSPGAGKTIALLQLAQRLIERSEQNLGLPIPVVFNLSSWAKNRKRIVDWLIDELLEKYQVPKSLSEPWIRQQQIILLLDGLDEVNETSRNDCVRALNEFIGLFPQTEVSVCSRVRDYEVLTERLEISSALCLQPLSSEQIYRFLDHIGGPLVGLKTLLKRDVDLEQFAQTPLILYFMSVAYQGWSVEELIPRLHAMTDRCLHLFDTYIDRRLERGSASEYSKDKVLHWLSWLASRMVQEKRTIFLIEKLQPTWLKNPDEKKTFQIQTFIFSGLIYGLIGALLFGLMLGQIYSLTGGSNTGIYYLVGGLSGGLIGGLNGGISNGFSKEIIPLEKLNWSWERAKSRFLIELFFCICIGLFFVLIFGLIFILIIRLVFGKIEPLYFSVLLAGLILALVFGLIGGLIRGLISGLGSSTIEQQTGQNQGIWSSWRNCLIVGLWLWLIVSLVNYLVFEPIFSLTFNLINSPKLTEIYSLKFTPTSNLIFGLTSGLIAGASSGLKYGGAACIQHLSLRQMLCQNGRIPWNYAKFLDFASDRLLMKKIGGGYVFFHRMLLEHFAQMKQD
jgi:NACHT domain/CHAT domain